MVHVTVAVVVASIAAEIKPEDAKPSAAAETVQLATIVSETLNVVVAVAAWALGAAFKQRKRLRQK